MQNLSSWRIFAFTHQINCRTMFLYRTHSFFVYFYLTLLLNGLIFLIHSDKVLKNYARHDNPIS